MNDFGNDLLLYFSSIFRFIGLTSRVAWNVGDLKIKSMTISQTKYICGDSVYKRYLNSEHATLIDLT